MDFILRTARRAVNGLFEKISSEALDWRPPTCSHPLLAVRPNPTFSSMSQAHPTSSTSTSSSFQSIFNAALEQYENKTKKKLLTHPLFAQLQSCNSPAAIL